MSLPLSHAGGSVDGISAALDLRFASSLSLTSTSGITPSFSRASGGTFTGSDGLLKYTPLNTVLYSEQLDNVYWSRIASTISADSAVAPDGKTTADKLVETATTSTHRVYKETAGNINGAKYYWSFYAKASERSWVILDSSDATTNFLTWFNLSNGTIGTVDGARTASIQSVGNGWYRCSVYGNLITGTTVGIQAYTATGDGVSSFLGNSSAGLYIWGMQITRSESLGDYAQTTTAANSAPRFNHVYNGSSWVSKGLLVEEQRTNLLQYSESFSISPWSGLGTPTITTNTDIAPDGLQTADTINDTSNGSFWGISQSFPTSSGSTYTFSIYIKKTSTSPTNYPLIQVQVGSSSYSGIIINTLTGAISVVSGGSYVAPTSYYSSDNSNYWRISITVVINLSTSQVQFYPAGSSDGLTISSASTGLAVVWGSMVELGSFPTSYIPTTTAAVTRSADVCQITGGDFSGFYNQTEGSFAVNYDCPANGTLVQYQANSAASTNIHTAVSIGTTQYFQVFLPPEQALLNAGSIAANVSQSLSSAYKLNDFAASLNGGAVATDTAGSLPTPTKLVIGSDGSIYNNGHIARLRYFNKRLTNKQLEDLCKPEQQLKLDLNFSSSLSLTPTVGPTPSYSRASTGTYFNASGVLTSAAINAPRFDHVYDGTNWVSKGLLIEEQRTNNLLQSNSFSTTWVALDGAVVANSGTSPDGTNNAWKLNELATTTASHGIYQTLTIPGGACTWSIFAKAGERSWLQFLAYNSATNFPTWFNLSNGTIGTNAAGNTAAITPVGNGWYRCSLTRSAGAAYAQIYTANGDNNASYLGQVGNGIYIYGAQVETGSFPTSYIPTVASSVVRSADVCQITGSAFTNLWNASEGSIAFEADAIDPRAAASAQTVYSADDGNSTNSIYALRSGSSLGSDYWVASYRAGALQFNFTTAADFWSINVPFKSAIGFKLNDTAQSSKGLAVVTDTSCIVPTGLTQLTIGRLSYTGGTGFPLNGHISRLRYYAIRLPNRLLIAKST